MLQPFGLYAKIDAILAGLYGPAGLARLAEVSTVAELVEALRIAPAYGPFFEKIESGRLTLIDLGGAGFGRTDVERALMQKPVLDLSRLLPFTTSEPRAFLRTLLRGFEAENLKRAFRRLFQGRGRECLPSDENRPEIAMYDLAALALLPPAKLRAAAGPAELLALLEGTPFHRPVSAALPQAETQGSVFPIEAALDDDHLGSCWRAAGRLAGADRERVRGLLGVEADLLSLVWTYRGRFLLGLRPDEVLPLLPGFGARLGPAARRELTSAETPAAFGALLAGGPYASLAAKDGTLDPGTLDVDVARRLLAEARGLRAGFRFNLAQVVAFLWIVDREVRDLGALAECLHYKLDHAAFGRHLAGWPS